MDSPVLQLQRRAVNSNASLSDLLRMAFTIAKKLKVLEFERWSYAELNGYGDESDLPDYRVVKGLPKAHNPVHGWVDMNFPDAPLADSASSRGFTGPIKEIEQILSDQGDDPLCLLYYAPEAACALQSLMPVPLTPALHVPVSQLHRILETVRNIVLEWALKLEGDGILGDGIDFSTEEKQIASSHTYNIDTYIHLEKSHMGDTYSAGQAGAMGPNAHSENINFNQIWNQVQGGVDLVRFAEQLSLLRGEMKKQAVDVDHDVAVSEIAQAEQVAKLGDGPKALKHLRAAGKWALDLATQIGAGVVVELITRSAQ